MNDSHVIGWAGRFLLALALVASPIIAMPASHAGTDPSAAAEAMPCHDEAPATAAEPPCDDGCCPQPDCDPASCRVNAPLVGISVWPVPMISPDPHAGTWQAAIPAAAPTGVQLRPPIA